MPSGLPIAVKLAELGYNVSSHGSVTRSLARQAVSPKWSASPAPSRARSLNATFSKSG